MNKLLLFTFLLCTCTRFLADDKESLTINEQLHYSMLKLAEKSSMNISGTIKDQHGNPVNDVTASIEEGQFGMGGKLIQKYETTLNSNYSVKTKGANQVRIRFSKKGYSDVTRTYTFSEKCSSAVMNIISDAVEKKMTLQDITVQEIVDKIPPIVIDTTQDIMMTNIEDYPELMKDRYVLGYKSSQRTRLLDFTTLSWKKYTTEEVMQPSFMVDLDRTDPKKLVLQIIPIAVKEGDGIFLVPGENNIHNLHEALESGYTNQTVFIERDIDPESKDRRSTQNNKPCFYYKIDDTYGKFLLDGVSLNNASFELYGNTKAQDRKTSTVDPKLGSSTEFFR